MRYTTVALAALLERASTVTSFSCPDSSANSNRVVWAERSARGRQRGKRRSECPSRAHDRRTPRMACLPLSARSGAECSTRAMPGVRAKLFVAAIRARRTEGDLQHASPAPAGFTDHAGGSGPNPRAARCSAKTGSRRREERWRVASLRMTRADFTRPLELLVS